MRTRTRKRSILFSGLLLALLGSPASAQVEIDWVTVSNPGNPCDTRWAGCFRGTVDYEYRISKYEITNLQYVAFLNAVAVTDNHGLYPYSATGIVRTGSSGSYAYSVVPGQEQMPVNDVSFWMGTRFANWLHNDQPSGAQDDSTTEDGAYTLTPAGVASNTVTRNPGARFFMPSLDEWYKAAFYDPGSMGYYAFPTGSDTPPTCSVPGPGANAANCDDVVDATVAAGSYPNSPSPVGTFHQAGNLAEWVEVIIDFGGEGSFRGVLGGTYTHGTSPMGWDKLATGAPGGGPTWHGLRLAAEAPIPVPLPLLGPIAGWLLAAGLGSFGVLRLRR